MNPDEQILELYMDLASTKDGDDSSRGTGGLGFLDSSSSFLELELILTPKKELLEVSNDKGLRGSTSAKSKKGVKKDAAKEEVRLNVQIQQDLMALKGRKGDTGMSLLILYTFLLTRGSVLWRSRYEISLHGDEYLS